MFDNLHYIVIEELLLIGGFLVEAGESDVAVRVLKLVLDAGKYNQQLNGTPYACNHLACIYKEKKNYDEAIHYAEEALATRKKMTSLGLRDGDYITWQLHETLGEFHFHKKNLEKARIYYLKAIEEYPVALKKLSQPLKGHKIWEYTQNLGIINWQLYSFGEALMWFTRSLEYIKEHKIEDPMLIHNSYRQIGLMYQQLGQHEQALSYFESALKSIDGKLPPQNLYVQIIHFTTSQTLEELKRIDESLDLLVVYYKKLINPEGEANEETEKVKAYVVHKCNTYGKSEKMKDL